MKTYIITYDLVQDKRKTPEDYKPLYKALQSYKVHERLTESIWLIKSDKAIEVIVKELLQLLDLNDRIFGIEVIHNTAWWNLLCSDERMEQIL